MASDQILEAPSIDLRPYRYSADAPTSAWSALPRTRLHWSPGHQLGFVSPMPATEELERYYQSEYRARMGKSMDFAEHRASPNRMARARSQVAWVRRIAGPTGDWLDVGAGYGLLLDEVRRQMPGFSRAAVEPDREAGSTLDSIADQVHSPATLWGSRQLEARFDVISLSHVLEHLVDPVEGLTQLFRCLRPGGLLMLEVPNDHLTELTRDLRRNDLPHLWFFSQAGLEQMARSAGFAVLRSAEIGLRRPGVYASLRTRVRRYIARKIAGDKSLLSDADWYCEARDRTDIRLLCWKPTAECATALRQVGAA